MGRLYFSGMAADVSRLALLTTHVYGYVGEKNTCTSHMSETPCQEFTFHQLDSSWKGNALRRSGQPSY